MELDPSLIEIAGEDDSLLQQIPTLDNYYFLCSPPQIPCSNGKANLDHVSSTMVLKDNVNVKKSTCSSPVASRNKENINAKKQEVPKLCLEPQQMKRTKRGGAYNLRKSLAWNRAFFTEEGVLTPLELSLLSGSISNSSSEVLPSIHEEQKNVSNNSSSTSDSAAMQGMPKVLSNRKSSRTGSKGGGCPRPLINSSLKRPANASITNVQMKESKPPKLPVSRPSAHSLPISSKSVVIGTSHSKQNQFSQKDIFQKSGGLQGSFKTLKISANNGNSGSDSSTMAAKPSCQPPRRNMANVALEVRLSTNPQPTLSTKATCGLDVFPDAVHPRSGSRVLNSHNVSSKSGIPTAKPSGLRMPSPSLDFFGQTKKSSASNTFSGKATPSSNLPKSYTPRLQRFNTTNFERDSRLLHARGKVQKVGDDSTISENSSVSVLSKECSVPCSGNDVSRENGKMKLEGNNEPMKYQLVEDSQEVPSFIDADKQFQECGKTHKDASSHKESDFLMNDTFKYTKMNDLENTNFASQHNFVVLPEGDSGMNDPNSFGVGTHAVIFEYESENAAGDLKQDLVIPHNDDSSAVCDLDEYSRKKAQPLITSSGETDQNLYGDNHNFVSDDGILFDRRNSFDSQRYQRENNANVNFSICLSSKSSPSESAENESVTVAGPSNDKLHLEDVQLHFLDTTPLAKCCDYKLPISEVHDQDIERDDDSERSGYPPKPQSCCLLVEEPSEDPGATQAGGAVHEIVDQPQEKAALSSPSRMVSSIENCESYCGTQFGSDLSLKTSRDHLAVDTCDSIMCCSLNKEEGTVANALKNNILAENFNFISNDGIFLEARNSFDSQGHEKENVANVPSSIRETNKSENLCCKSPPCESAANESGPGVDPSNDKLHVEDVQVHFLDTISLAKYCDYKLHLSEVHDQDIECDADRERFGQPLKPQNCCLLVEEPSEDPGANQVRDVAVHEMVEQPQEKATLSSPCRMISSSIENSESYTITQFGSDLSLQMSRDHVAVDTCDSIVCCSLNKEEETVANALKNNILAENCNLMSNDGILLEGRNSFDSQIHQKENVANVMSSIREVNKSEKLCSKNPPSESPANESGPIVDPSNDKLHVEDVQVYFLDTTSLAKCCDYKLLISEVHDQDIEGDDDSERSGQPLKPQSCCLLVEQPSEVNHGFLLHDYSLLSEGTPAEEFHGVLGPEDPGATQADVAVHEMVDQPQEKVTLSSPSRMVSSIENCESYSDTQSRSDLSLNTSSDHLAVDTCDPIMRCSLNKEEETVANALKNNILEENTDTEFSFENPHVDNEVSNVNGGVLFWGNRSLEEFHSGDGGNSTDASFVNQNCSGSELEICQSASLFEYTEQANEDTTGIVDKTADELCSANTEVQYFDGNLLVGSSNSGFQYNHDLHLNDYLLHGKSTSSDEPHEVLEHVPFVQERNDDCSETKTFCGAIQVPLSVQDSGIDMEEHQTMEHAPLRSLDEETSTEYSNHSTDTILGNDMMFSVQATSSESDLAVMTGDADQSIGEITNKAFSLSEESGFSDQKIQTLANETDIMNLGVENANAILPDDFGVEISPTNVSPIGELQHKMDNAICLTEEEEDRTMPIKKSRDGEKKPNLTVNPPIIAVPFSDEWLSAMEAAGEAVLTMKSGAVQNSPSDRSLLEPGPWSPVKRNQNEIGPFDCTKFNIQPQDSDKLI